MFKKHDWIKVKDNVYPYGGSEGFVTNTNGDRVSVVLLNKYSKKFNTGCGVYMWDIDKVENSLTAEDYTDLQRFAIDTQDVEWAKELYERSKEFEK